MAITYFGSIGVPTDNGTSAASPVTFANPPIASMATGDLVIVYAYCRNAAATITINNAGGQTWTSETNHQSSTSTLTGRIFWCRFNGTWSAAPSFAFTSTTNTNCVMHVFRPNTSTNSWALITATNTVSENAMTSRVAAATWAWPLDAANFTPDSNDTVTIVSFITEDDNTWGTLTGTGWTQVTSPSAQFRNTSGNDVSSTYAYIIQGTAASIPVMGLTQTANGNDAGIYSGFLWREFTPAATALKDMIGHGIIPFAR